MTIKEIAELAGVTTMTVSNVINKKYGRVSKQTIDKVTSIIKEYNYVPNLSARSLTATSSKIIAVIVPVTQVKKNLFQDPYIAQILGILEENLRENGYFAMIRSISSVDEACTMLKNWKVSGAIFILPYFDDKIDQILLENKDIPLVFMDSYSNNPKALTVCIDDEKGAYLSTRFLLGLGHETIAFVGDFEANPLLFARYSGYMRAMEESDKTVNSSLIFKELPDYEGGRRAGYKIAENKDISAVITTSDICAVGIVEGARLSGLTVPKGLSVIGFDDLPIAVYSTPKLTTINQHIEKKAERAIDILFDRINGTDMLPNSSIIDIELVERQSTTHHS
jgi:DNA-binding LacI/PurR family transcriptional regulator